MKQFWEEHNLRKFDNSRTAIQVILVIISEIKFI